MPKLGGCLWNDIRVRTLDEGGQPIYDDEGTVIDRTEAIHELVLNEHRRVMISRPIKDCMKAYFFSMENVQIIWSCFINMDTTSDGYITL